MKKLLEMLTYKRPHGSITEFEFVNKFVSPYVNFGLMKDGLPAAYVVEILVSHPGHEGEYLSRTLFSSHVDTVHYTEGIQEVIFDKDKMVAYKTDGEPLGADDAAGVWVMLKMIEAGVPGTYLFHRGEEKGGIGSKLIADNHKDFLAQFDRAIAFDRKGTSSVITHQGCGRCCSDAFAHELACRLNDTMLNDAWAADDSGIYTDTAEYIYDIPECTNVSVGYKNEHSFKESLDVAFVMRLADACIALDWESLPVVRKTTDTDDSWGSFGFMRDAHEGQGWPGSGLSIEDFLTMSDKEIDDFCWDTPESAASLLMLLKDHLIYNQ